MNPDENSARDDNWMIDVWAFSPERIALHEKVIAVGGSYIQANEGFIPDEESDHKEREVMDYVGSLLQAQHAEIARLTARQITPEITTLVDEYHAWKTADHAPLQALEKGARLQREIANALLKTLKGENK